MMRAFVLTVLSLATLASSATADVTIGSRGTGIGQYEQASAVAIDNATGTVYLADTGNRRIDVFDSSGNFIRAFGWGVVAAGPGNKPQNEREQVAVSATGGAFVLRLVQNSVQQEGLIKQETTEIPFDASAAAVESSLDGLAAIGVGDVSVQGPDGGPWTVEFTGAYADTDMHELEGVPGKLTGGAKSVTVSTTQGGANYEVCEGADGDTCRAGQLGVLAGQLSPTAVAVDNDPASPSYHDVYVFDGLESSSTNEAPNNRVQKFTPEGTFIYMLGGGVEQGPHHPGNFCSASFIAEGDICGAGQKGTGPGQYDRDQSAVAVGPGGMLYVADRDRVQKYEPSGSPAGELAVPTYPFGPSVLAVNSVGDLYVKTGARVLLQYDATGTATLGEFSGPLLSELGAAAVDASDHLFVSALGAEPGISEYDSSGVLRAVFYSALERGALSLAPHHTVEGDIFAVERGSSTERSLVHIPFPPPGPVALRGQAGPLGNLTATLRASINPEGKSTTYHFEYVDQLHFETDGGFASPATKATPESTPIGSDFTLHEAVASVSGLTPETTYRVRAVPTNSDGTTEGREGSFETLEPVSIGSTFSTQVGFDSAKLHARVNPLGIAASGYFQYVDQATYESSGFAEAIDIPNVGGGANPIDLGAGEAEETASVVLAGLTPGTIFRFRFLATDSFKTAVGPERTFRTFIAPGEPPGGCPNQAFRTAASAGLPDCRAYEMVSPLDKNNGDIVSPANVTGYRVPFYQAATSGDGLTYSSVRSFGDSQSAPYTSQYLAKRGNGGWSTEAISPPQGALLTLPTNSTNLDNQHLAATADLSYSWFYSNHDPQLSPDAPEGFANVYRRDNATGAFHPLNTVAPPHPGRGFEPVLEGISADGSVAVFAVEDNLTEDASTAKITQLYISYGSGQLRLVSFMPNGSASQSGGSAGSPGGGYPIERLRWGNFVNALSEDGSRVYWNGPGGQIYLRENATEEQSTIDADHCTEPEKACTVPVSGSISSGAAHFDAASPDGSRALFTVGETLYQFNAASGVAAAVASNVSGILGASSDTSRVYFASTDAITGAAQAGSQNVYLHEAGVGNTFIATLSDDYSEEFTNYTSELFMRTTRVNSEGTHLAFVSTRSLTGYDNSDRASGKGDTEVYLYEAGGELLCVSCNPSGARPNGREADLSVEKRYNSLRGAGLAGFIEGWQTGIYASRALSEDGSRLFFNSADALTPRDTNGRRDVYEWEAPGKGSCTEKDPAYSQQNGGCIYLISSGESPGDSEFVDASPDGTDIFFTSGESLLPSDYGLVDIYVAREGGGYPPPSSPPVACEGEACQGPYTPPNDQTPASSSFEGAGNATQAKKRKAKGKKHKHRHKAKKAKGKRTERKGR